MQKDPLVVIITRTRDRPILLRRAIESVLNQSMTDWRHCIVNDGGNKSALRDILELYDDAYDGRLQLIQLDHAGMQNASNAAIEKTRSEFIAIHDDDDSWDKDFLQDTAAFLQKKGPDSTYQGVIGKTLRILEESQDDGSYKEIERDPYVPLSHVSITRLGYENPFPPIALLYRRSVHEQIGLFDPQWDLAADLDFNFKFLKQFEIGVINKTLAYYHWRNKAKCDEDSNTVTREKSRHATLLNELKNHYLRSATDPREAAMAITFVMSSFAVESQWMTGEIRERAKSTEQQVTSLIDEIRSIQDILNGLHLDEVQKFNHETLWPKLCALEESVKLNEPIQEQLSLLRKSNEESTWPKLCALEEASKLNNSIHEQVIELRKYSEASLWPKLDDITCKSQAALESLDQTSSQLKQLDDIQEKLTPLDALSQAIGTMGSRTEEICQLLDLLSNRLSTLEKENEAISAKQTSGELMLYQLASELKAMRETEGRMIKLGPLKITWGNPRTGKDSPDVGE